MDNKDKINIFWFRRDLRLHDNHGLYRALNEGLSVVPIFIFDRNILNDLPTDDARVTFIHTELSVLNNELLKCDSKLNTYYDTPEQVFTRLLKEYNVESIFCNHDYEPYAISRDTKIKHIANEKGAKFNSYKDHVIFEKDEILSNSNTPYTVFTPYKKKWLSRFTEEGIVQYNSIELMDKMIKCIPSDIISLSSMGFSKSNINFPSRSVLQKTIKNYTETRNFPAIANGTSRLGVHFRFGTISIREKVLKAKTLNDTYLSELIWRDFYSQILYHFPHVVNNAFRAKYDKIEWRNDEKEFEQWCKGQTGYPLVDAGMRELNKTGHMHNRVRMLTASFLTKHLLIDWRKGEAYFASRLLDYDLASNNGGWQWASGSGTDAAPYFRIFNPSSQLTKFDKELKYVKKWVPEYGTDQYPEPIVDHKFARQRCLDTYKKALS